MSGNNKYIIFIRGGGVGKLSVVDFVRENGYKIAIADLNYKNSTGWADEIINSDPNNQEQFISDVIEFCTRHDVAAILSFAEFGVELAAIITGILGFPGQNVNAVRACRNKYLTRVLTSRKGLPCPKFSKADSLGELKESFRKINAPSIIKPLNFAAASAVAKVNSEDEIEAVYKDLINKRAESPIIDYMLDTTKDSWLIEEYLNGFEISVESYTYEGKTQVIAIHDKLCEVEAPYFYEDILATPSPRISQDMADQIEKMTKDILEAVNYRMGLSHTEFRITPGGPVLVEVNARQGGTLNAESTFYSTGINLPQLLISMSLGVSPDINIQSRKPTVYKIIFAPSEGIIRSIDGFENAKQFKSIKIAEQWLKEGMPIKARQSDYVGSILGSGESMEDVLSDIRRAVSQVHICMD